MNNSEKASRLQEEVQSGRVQLNEVKVQVSSLLEEHKQAAVAAGVTGRTVLELETAVSSKRIANKVVLQGLSTLMQENAEAGAMFEQKCAESGVPPPDHLEVDDD